MYTTQYHATRKAWRQTRHAALSLLWFACSCVAVQAQVPPPPPDSFEHDGWIDAMVQGYMVTGSESTFQQRHQSAGGISGGVTSFFWETYPTRDLTFQLKFHSLLDQNDFALEMDLSKADGPYLQTGFRQFRQWYDGSGGFFPANRTWFNLPDDRLHIDVGNAWIEIGMADPDKPMVSLRYTHSYRRGQKDSTIWGRTGLTAGAGNRAIVPSYREIDESRHIIEGKVSHTIDSTEFGVGLRYETYSQNNSLNIMQFPEQPTEQHITQTEGVSSDLFSGHAWALRQLTETVRLSTSYLYTRIDNDITGSRTSFMPDTGTFQSQFTGMAGGTELIQHVVNMNMLWIPREHFLIIPSIRFENQRTDDLVTHLTTGPQQVRSEQEATNLSQRLELRYTGIARWRLYARGDWMQGDGDLREFPTTAAERITEFDRRHQRYTLGASWNPRQAVSASTQYQYSTRKNDYDHILPGRIGRHPAFVQKQDFKTHGFNVRVTTRPAAGVTLVSRYDLQVSEIHSQGSAAEGGQQVPLARIQSGDMVRHIFSQSVTWTPANRLYLQASAHHADSRLKTPANTTPGEVWSRHVLTSRNDYTSAILSAIFAYRETTDIDFTYSYFRAGNHEDNWANSVAYGVGEYEHGTRIGLSHRVSENFVLRGGYGFYLFRENLTGGNRNYDAHLLYSGMTLRF